MDWTLMGHLDCIYYFLLVGRNLRFPGCDRRRSKEEVIRKGERWAFLGLVRGKGVKWGDGLIRKLLN